MHFCYLKYQVTLEVNKREHLRDLHAEHEDSMEKDQKVKLDSTLMQTRH